MIANQAFHSQFRRLCCFSVSVMKLRPAAYFPKHNLSGNDILDFRSNDLIAQMRVQMRTVLGRYRLYLKTDLIKRPSLLAGKLIKLNDSMPVIILS